jgi:uncharacterized membrane protein
MNTFFYLKLYLLTIPVFFAIDLFWLGVIAKGLYQKNLGHLLSPDVNWPAAFAFYFIYIVSFCFLLYLHRGHNSLCSQASIGR